MSKEVEAVDHEHDWHPIGLMVAGLGSAAHCVICHALRWLKPDQWEAVRPKRKATW